MGQNVVGQQFRTKPLGNDRPAAYSLAIRQSDGQPGSKFRFPLSPRNIRRQYVSMGNYYDVAGTPKEGGVNRIVDSYGNSPLIFLLEGTTGWQRHNADAYQQTGIEIILQLQKLLGSYAEACQSAQAVNKPSPTLEFADTFLGSLWQVEPMGEQGYRQDAQQPLYVTYSFRLVGIRDLGQPEPEPADLLMDDLSTTAAAASTSLQAQISNVGVNYAAKTSLRF